MSTMRACAWGDRSTAACRTSLADGDVVDVAALAAQEALVLDPLDRLAEHPRRHDASRPVGRAESRSGGRARVETRRPARRPAAPTARCWCSRCSGTGCRRPSRARRPRSGAGWSRRPAVIVVRKPGVQKPHCRPWHSANACCTGPSEPSGPASPSTVVISQSTAETANIRHDRTGRAVDQHGARAADAVLAADVRAGQAEVVTQRVGEQPPGRQADVVGRRR